MSDTIEDVETIPAPSEESRAWARRYMHGVREVQALHTPRPLWFFDGDDTSYEDPEEAVDSQDFDGDAEAREQALASLKQFVVCKECARMEQGVASDVGYEASQWPCATAIALGIEEGDLL